MPDPTVTEKPKPRRRKAKRSAANPSAPKKPRTTLLSRIEAMGPTHVAAYRTLAQGNPAFALDLDAALKADAYLAIASERHKAALDKATAAGIALGDAKHEAHKAQAVLAKLDRVARTIAQERGDVPTDDATAPTVAPASAAD